MPSNSPQADRREFLSALSLASLAALVPRGAFAQKLLETAETTEGPFYPDRLPLDTDNDLLILNDGLTPAVGEITHLTGHVFTSSGLPIRNAFVEIWQTDADGSYVHTGGRQAAKPYDANFQGYGRFLSDAKAVQRLVSQGMVQLIQDVLFVIGAIAVLTYLNLLVGLGTALLLPLTALLFWRINPRVQKASRDTRYRRTLLSAHLNERLSGLAVVKIHGRQREEAKRAGKLNRNVASRGARLAAAGGRLQGASAATVALVTTLTLGLAAEEVAAGRLTAGYLVTSYALIGLLAPVVQRITIVNRTLQEAQISVERLAQTLAEEPESPQEEQLPEVEVSEGLVSIEGVSFSYPDGTLALENVSLTARRGELVALVGPNGAGKSTLLELLPRFRQPTNGRIVIDGQDIAGVSLESLRSKIGFVTQDTPLFDGTITENVTYGVRGDASEVSEEQIQQAARLAGVDELVASLPEGWETKVREGRRMLSSGQRQRVVLARALAADPPIIVLDEVGSVLDIEAQRTLSEQLRVLAKHKTVIVATHSMPAMLMADRVYRMEGGRIVEEDRDEAVLTRLEGT